MKIYHTETQKDYDALMVELEAEGCEWLSGRKPTEAPKNWKTHTSETCVRVDKKVAVYDKKDLYARNCPDVQIIKYKAKTEDKMKFTKENVEGLVSNYFDDNIGECPGNLIAEIYTMDDTPEKVPVPKSVAEWIEWNKQKGVSLQTMIMYYKGFYDTVNSHPKEHSKKAVQWYVDNPYKFIQAYEKGYTIEPEQLYYIPLPHLQTSGGIQQVLSKHKNDTHYLASRPTERLQQRYTKEELAQVPEVYKSYAKPIEGE